jgi:hypothetical protein
MDIPPACLSPKGETSWSDHRLDMSRGIDDFGFTEDPLRRYPRGDLRDLRGCEESNLWLVSSTVCPLPRRGEDEVESGKN